MFAGVLFTTIVSCANALFSFAAFVRRPRGHAPGGVVAYAWFWLFMGLGWLLTAVQSVVWYLDLRSIAIASAYILQINILAALLWSVRFAWFEVLGQRYTKIIAYGYAAASILFLVTLFFFPLRLPKEQFFANHIISAKETFAVFTVMVVPLVASSWVLLARSYRAPLSRERTFRILASLSFILLGIAGSFDESGFVSDWMVTASRLITLIASILSYIAITGFRETEEQELTV